MSLILSAKAAGGGGSFGLAPGVKPTAAFTINRTTTVGANLIWYNHFNMTDEIILLNDSVLTNTIDNGDSSLVNEGSVGPSRKTGWYGAYFRYTDDSFMISNLTDTITFFMDFEAFSGSYDESNTSFIFANGDYGTAYNWGIYRHVSTHQLRAYIKNAAGTSVSHLASMTTPQDVRHRIVCTYDGSYIKIWINGVYGGATAQSGGLLKTSSDIIFNRWNASNHASAHWYQAGVLNIALSDADALNLSLDNYHFLQPA